MSSRASRSPRARRTTVAGRALLALFVAAAPLLKSCTSGAAAPAPVPFDADRAWQHLERLVGFGPRPAKTEALETTRQYLSDELRSYGLEPVREDFVADTPIGEVPMANVYADVPAASPDAPRVVLCTHFDTKILPFEFVGANDGGSGTAVLLELARVLAAGPPRDVAYRVLFLDGEESIRHEWVDPDNTYGSRYHTEQLLKSGESNRVAACVLLDMVGDRDLKLNTEMYSDRDLRRIFFDAARDNGLGEYVGGRRELVRDDHLPFQWIGVPSVNLIDFEYGPEGGDLREWWHTAEDTLDKCSRESLGVVGRIVLHGLPALEEWALEQRG